MISHVSMGQMNVSDDVSDKCQDFFFLVAPSVFHGPLHFPGGSEVTASPCNAGDLGLIPGSGRSPGEGNGNPLQ